MFYRLSVAIVYPGFYQTAALYISENPHKNNQGMPLF